MHAAIVLVVYWALAFVSLALAVVLLNIYSSIISNDLELRGVGAEAAIAGVASLVEAAGLWLLVEFIPHGRLPLAVPALFLPVFIVAVIYKATHMEDWSRLEIFLLLAFQLIIGFVGGSLALGQFGTAIAIVVCFGAILAVLATFARDLWD